MAYVKTNWVAGVTPLSEANMDHLEEQYDEASTDLTTHAALTTGAHGVGAGAIVGTTLVQTLSNKTLTAPTLNGTTVLGATPIFNPGAGNLEVTTTGQYKGLRMVSTYNDVGGTAITQYHNKGTANAADGDAIAHYVFFGDTDTTAEVFMGQMTAYITDVTHATRTSNLDFWLINSSASNLAMTLSGAGELDADAAIAGDAFDALDDGMVIIKRNLRQLCEIGVMRRKRTGSKYMLNFQKSTYLSWGAIRQTRQLIEAMARLQGIPMNDLIKEAMQVPDSNWKALSTAR